MVEKKSGLSKRRGAGKILLATTLAGTAATSAMTQSATTSAGFMDLLKSVKAKVSSALTKVKDKLPTTNTLIKTVISAAGAISLKGPIKKLIIDNITYPMDRASYRYWSEYGNQTGDISSAMRKYANSNMVITNFSKALTVLSVVAVGYLIYKAGSTLIKKVKESGKYLLNKVSEFIKERDKDKENYKTDNNKMSLKNGGVYQKNSKSNNLQEGNDISNKELVSSQANIDNSKTLKNLGEESRYNVLKNVSNSLNIERNSTKKEIFNDDDLKRSDSLRNRSYQINRNKIRSGSILANGQYNNFFDPKDKGQDVSNSLIRKELVKNRYEDNVSIDDNSNINEDLDVNEGEKLDKDGFKISDLRNYRSYEINNEVNRIKNSNSADDEDDNLVNYDDKNLSKGKSYEYGGFTFYDDDKSNESNPIKNTNEGFGWEQQ